MMSDQEIKIIDDLIQEHKPEYCLEWGSGTSTTYFPKSFMKLWLSIEHNGHYLDDIRYRCPENVQTIWILPGSSYADAVQRSNRKFDLILIDGLDRQKCLENALQILNDGGIILLHDGGRNHNDEIVERYGGIRLTEGEKPVNEGGYAHRGLVLFRKQS